MVSLQLNVFCHEMNASHISSKGVNLYTSTFKFSIAWAKYLIDQYEKKKKTQKTLVTQALITLKYKKSI